MLETLQRFDKVAKLYLASQFFRALYFSWPIWYGFATKHINPIQVGIFFSVLGFIQLIAEIPTGAFADKYGRKTSALLGSCIVLGAPLLIYFIHTFSAFILAALLYGIGRAFLSGSLDSLVYDHPNISKETYRKINSFNITIFQAGLIVSSATGGLLYTLHPSLPFIAEFTTGCICLVLILFMQEGAYKQSHTETYAGHFFSGIKYLFATHYLRVVVLMGVVYSVMLSICVDFVNEAAMIEHGIEPSVRGLLIAGAKLLTLVILNLFLLKLLKNDRAKMIFLTIGSVTAFAFLSMNGIALFLVGYIVWNWLVATQGAFFSPILHDNLPSSHRSTAVSSFNALISLIEFGATAFIGFTIQSFHTPRSAYILFTIISVGIIIPCGLWISQHLKVYNTRT